MLYVLGVDDFSIEEKLSQRLESLGMLTKELLGSLVLEANDLSSL